MATKDSAAAGYEATAAPAAMEEPKSGAKGWSKAKGVVTQKSPLQTEANTASTKNTEDNNDAASVKSAASASGSASGSANGGASGSANSGNGGDSGKKRTGKREKTEEEKRTEKEQKENLRIISELFTLANKGKNATGDEENSEDDDGAAVAAKAAAKAKAEAKANEKTKGGLRSMFGTKTEEQKAANDKEGKESVTSASINRGGKVPDTFDSMIRFNANMTGADPQFVEIMLRAFPQLISDICYSGTLQEQTDFLAMEMRKECTVQVSTKGFRPVLMSSLAALLPKKWNVKAEQAWAWFWDSLDAQLQESLKMAKVHETPTVRWVKSLDKMDFDCIGEILWTKLFAQEKQAELQHKQPTATFVRISTLALTFCAQIHEDPYRMKNDIMQHALKHILHQVDVKLFLVFVNLMEEEVRQHSKDEATTAALVWSLSVIASLMARTVKVSSNPVLTAAVKNDVKGLKKALGQVGRKDRTNAVLNA